MVLKRRPYNNWYNVKVLHEQPEKFFVAVALAGTLNV